MEDLAYTIQESVQIAKVSRAKFYQLWDQGKGPRTFKVGRKVLISADSLRQWIKSLENAGEE